MHKHKNTERQTENTQEKTTSTTNLQQIKVMEFGLNVLVEN